MRFTLRRLAVALALLLVPALVAAFGTRVHALLPRLALGEVVRDTAPGVTDADLAAFRLWLYSRASQLEDLETRRRFLARYPRADAFDARAMKEFLMMDGAARVLGVDPFASVAPRVDIAVGAKLPVMKALELGSIYPDLDRRNQNRLLRGDDLAPVRTASGDSVPFDPMTLNMGGLVGLSSQAHAHYGLNRHPKSSDPQVLSVAPWDFAIAAGFEGPVETYGPDNAQLYTDLALLAMYDGRPSGRALGAIYAGNAAHYLADVGNAIHTVQVGVYPIFVDATVQHYLRSAARLFGLFGRAPSRNKIGIDIIGNLHTFSERLYEVELVTGEVEPPTPSDSLRVQLEDTVLKLRSSTGAPDFARAIAAALVDAGNRDGASVYRITRDMVRSELRLGKLSLDFDTVPDGGLRRWLKTDAEAPARLRLFNDLEARGLARTNAAMRTWWAELTRELGYRSVGSRENFIDHVVTRLVSERLRYLEAAESRRAVWLSRHGGLASR